MRAADLLDQYGTTSQMRGRIRRAYELAARGEWGEDDTSVEEEPPSPTQTPPVGQGVPVPAGEPRSRRKGPPTRLLEPLEVRVQLTGLHRLEGALLVQEAEDPSDE